MYVISQRQWPYGLVVTPECLLALSSDKVNNRAQFLTGG